jgi:acrylyl-CoA reductase (NADPH)
MAPRERRIEAWERIASQLDHKKLDALTTTIGFDDIVAAANEIVAGKIRGRVIVDMQG